MVIEALFLPHEVDVIKSIPISSRLPPDKLIWTETRNGLFTVRSAYKLVVNQLFSSNRASSLDASNLQCFWSKVWSMEVPHKIQHFVWKACHDALPTKNSLMRWKVIQEDLCDSCKEARETMGHVLWCCPKAREAWECSKLVLPRVDGANMSFQDIMWKLLMDEVIGEDQVEQIATISWALWHNQKEIRCGGARKSGKILFRWASDYLMEYRAAVAQTIPVPSLPRHDATWCPPRGGHFKINVYGAIFSKQKAVGIGVVIRDDEGRLEAALSKKILVHMGVLEVEAKALKTGFLFAKDVGVRDVILEGLSSSL
ncbi:hypothetical protein SO802_034114 [Lithocarpus litseifolius]|uniref:Reverse transcriptase zinc-binding domain-containing protein n=1 Tax=Lithocarpus litseifolius TaxID=425828 RepID=A0AAW2BIH2_9ROSI